MTNDARLSSAGSTPCRLPETCDANADVDYDGRTVYFDLIGISAPLRLESPGALEDAYVHILYV